MPFFWPTWFFDKVEDVSPEFLKEQGIRAVILDVDNTLTTHDNPVPKPTVRQWLDGLVENGIRLLILSNNSEERVRPFAEILRLPFIANGKKPLKSGVRRALLGMEIKREEALIIGDQVFTDVLAGRFSGVRTLLVKPLEPEQTRFFMFKRAAERLVLGKRR